MRASADDALARLRDNASFDAVAPFVPQLEPWIDPDRFEPITDAMAGGGLTNSYHGQLDEDGHVGIPGVFFVGDAVCTTNPAAGRGVCLGLRQAQALIAMLADPRADARDVVQQYDAWAAANIRPWYEDHVYWDATLLRRFDGHDIDVDARIPSDVVCAAAMKDPGIWPAAGPYLAMQALPSILDPMQDTAREVLRSGWRPPYADGPSRAELADLMLEPVR